MSKTADVEIAEKKDESVKKNIPNAKIFLLPYMSAILPIGTRNIAAARRNEVATQLNRTGSIKNSFPINGSAMFIEELINAVMKELRVVTNKAVFLYKLIS
jgi:hypothetical protein